MVITICSPCFIAQYSLLLGNMLTFRKVFHFILNFFKEARWKNYAAARTSQNFSKTRFLHLPVLQCHDIFLCLTVLTFSRGLFDGRCSS